MPETNKKEHRLINLHIAQNRKNEELLSVTKDCIPREERIFVEV